MHLYVPRAIQDLHASICPQGAPAGQYGLICFANFIRYEGCITVGGVYYDILACWRRTRTKSLSHRSRPRAQPQPVLNIRHTGTLFTILYVSREVTLSQYFKIRVLVFILSFTNREELYKGPIWHLKVVVASFLQGQDFLHCAFSNVSSNCQDAKTH